ncbi:MAG: lipoate--protein ligase family protein [Cyclobacteriaceae bacterium]|nr:lipoate--protein ligase family protein [Cyclobacteriaceae bacterium]
MIRWIDAGKVSGLKSQSIYHGLGYSLNDKQPNTIVVLTPEDPYFCIGFFQDAYKELDVRFCKDNNLPIIRRETGGGAVYIDSNQLFVQWIFHPGSLPPQVDKRFQWFIEPMVETYKFFGIDAYYHPVNDVHVHGKKVVGTGAAHIGNAEIVTGNFIFSFNNKSFVDALACPDSSFKNLVRESMDLYMTSMKQENIQLPSMGELKKVYLEKCREFFSDAIEEGGFSSNELAEIDQIEKKFVDDEWIFEYSEDLKYEEKLLKIHADVWVGRKVFVVNNSKIVITYRINSAILDFVQIQNNEGGSNLSLTNFEKYFTGLSLVQSEFQDELNKSYTEISGSDDVSMDFWLKAFTEIWEEKKKKAGHA